jgi:hypothetical protein
MASSNKETKEPKSSLKLNLLCSIVFHCLKPS